MKMRSHSSLSLLSRRAFLSQLAAAPIVLRRAFAAERLVDIGAIRWDAWYEKTGESVFPQNNLGYAPWRGRAPVHCRIADDSLVCTGDQKIMDAEIEAAHSAGIAYWAFDWYGPASSLRRGWRLYQSSSLNTRVRWCPIAGCGDLGSASGSPEEIAAKAEGWTRMFRSSNYFRARVNQAERPLFYIYYRENEMRSYFGTLERMRAALEALRARAAKSGIGEPYFILFDPAADRALLSASGADAMSNYIAGFRPEISGPYADLDAQARQYWAKMASKGAKMAPIAQVGWDTRPRHERPVPWEKGPPPPHDQYYAIATPEEFEAHIRAAIRFVRDHSEICDSGTVLVYSWDECDEGGCILPTLGDRDGRYLVALKAALRN